MIIEQLQDIFSNNIKNLQRNIIKIKQNIIVYNMDCKQNGNRKSERTGGCVRINTVAAVSDRKRVRWECARIHNNTTTHSTAGAWQLHLYHSSSSSRYTSIYTIHSCSFVAADTNARSEGGGRPAVGMRGCDEFWSTERFNLNLNIIM